MLRRFPLLACLALAVLAGSAMAQGVAPVPGGGDAKADKADKTDRADKAVKADKAIKSETPDAKGMNAGKPDKAARAAPGQNPRGQVARYLVDARANMKRRGFTQCRPTWIVSLAENRPATKSFSMVAGKACEVAARCDNDCNDIDLWINSPRGGVIGEAVGLSDEEHLAFVPTVSADFAIKTAMPGCRNKQGCVGGVLVCCSR